ncbi:MAG TPA: hypothetical protein VFA48_08780 [Gammaproteobacteria bacterium]|nr:hypothetical protein [Gammaproteobacteria bacterium]
MVTEAQTNEYLRTRGVRCLYCGSDDLHAGASEFDAGLAWQEVSCGHCGASWQDQYTLTGVAADEDVHTPPDPAALAESAAGETEQDVLVRLGFPRDPGYPGEPVDGNYVEHGGEAFFAANLPANVRFHQEILGAPVYEASYFDCDGNWDVHDRLHVLGVRWIVLVSHSYNANENTTTVLVGRYSEESLRFMVRHVMEQAVVVPGDCAAFPELLDEVIAEVKGSAA